MSEEVALAAADVPLLAQQAARIAALEHELAVARATLQRTHRITTAATQAAVVFRDLQQRGRLGLDVHAIIRAALESLDDALVKEG